MPRGFPVHVRLRTSPEPLDFAFLETAEIQLFGVSESSPGCPGTGPLTDRGRMGSDTRTGGSASGPVRSVFLPPFLRAAGRGGGRGAAVGSEL